MKFFLRMVRKTMSKYNVECGARSAEFEKHKKKKFRIPNSEFRIKKLFAAAIFISLVILQGCSMKVMVADSTGLIMDDIIASFLEERDLEFAEQSAPANLKLLDGLIKATNWGNDNLLIKGCKLYTMYAMGFLEDTETERRKEKKQLKRASKFYEKAKNYGLAVLDRNNDFKQARGKSLDEFKKVMPAFGKDDVESLMWAAFAWGQYINLNRHKVAAIAELPKARVMIERAIELDSEYFYGMSHIFMIVYYSMPKMFGGDPVKAKEEYETISKITGGKFILAEFFMAKYYAVQEQDKKFFEELLEKIDEAEEDVIPEYMLTLVAKKKAEILSKKAKNLF